jgi:hypothetical protein
MWGNVHVSDEKPYFATPGLKIPPRQPVPGELLLTFERAADLKTFRCELRDHGRYEVEAQFFDPVDLVIAQTFQEISDGERTIPARELAIAWAKGMRETIESYVEGDE